MKHIFLFILSKIIVVKSFIIRLAYRIWGVEMLLPEPPRELPLNSLSPVADADADGVFCSTLYWALKKRNERDIRNIAITGPYGSGKSSLLKTFREKHKNDSDLKFLNISLATFKEHHFEQKEFDGGNLNYGKTSGEDLLRLIELSILQQLFYFEKDQSIPDSRFKRIKSFSKINIWTTAIVLSFFTLALCHQINPCLITKSLLQKCIWPTPGWLHYSTLSIIVLFGFLILLKSIRVLRSITLKSLKLNDTAEFEISESINKSILNHHLDEIIYFFQVTKYTVVIIEDLDRFEQTEIFTKLRELNLLINNSRKINRGVVFIYAVRDELFREEKERTKFFDFIIPIIPVVNASNSGEKLLKILEQSNHTISKDLIEDVTLFIDDMRLLYNITNEYYMYAQKLDIKSNQQDKLFAMMVYKNLYPDDFVKLSNGAGDLFKFFDERDTLLNELLEVKNKQIQDNKNEIKRLEELQIVDIHELRKLFLVQYVSQLPNITHFVINEADYSLNQIDEIANNEELFDVFVENEVSYKALLHSHSNLYTFQNRTIEISFVDIGDQIDDGATYFDRLELITDFHNDKTELLRNEIGELERQKIEVKNQPIKAILQQQSLMVKLDNSKQQQLVNILLRNGYIDEHYHDYISIFYEGSITKEDREFLLNVKAQISTEYSYKLVKISNLIGKINQSEFNYPHILNYDLVDYLFGTNRSQTLKKAILKLLSNESESSITFLNGFIDVGVNNGKLIRSLAEQWPNFWKSISKNSTLPQERIRLFLSLLLEFGELSSIIIIAKQSDLKAYLEGLPDFFSLAHNKKKLFKIVEDLQLKFKQLDFEITTDEETQFVYEGNYYEINDLMVTSLIKKNGVFNQLDFNRCNYEAITNSKAGSLIEYLLDNIEDYCQNIYLKIDSNIHEKEEYFIEILDNESLSNISKNKIITKLKTKVSRLANLNDKALFSELLNSNKIVPSWENLLCYYDSQITEESDQEQEERQISKSLITFINDLSNAKALSKIKIPLKVDEKNIYGEFYKKVIQINEISNEAYNLITKSSPWWYTDLDLGNLNENKIKSLIDNNCITPNKESFESLKTNSLGLNTYHFEKQKDKYLVILDQLTFDESDLEYILKSEKLKNTDKKRVLDVCADDVIQTTANLKQLSSILMADKKFEIDDEILSLILRSQSVSITDRISLFNHYSNKFEKTFIEHFIESLGNEYSKILNRSVKAKIQKTAFNEELLKILKRNGLISSVTPLDKFFRINHKRK